ncbi:TauD/TfdA family dioxygenase [Pseudomonas fontis]|uniref:TauD/TfdA family dioxygenase n=1 Tax=Pseudomonas fontis TaxID=2942633 RepID=A0ABT5NYX4_9PSED|nr:TauD/TfdA family dioxygenase [Pseudomonas fontis]MDD0976703.1 TauD/TfdA family dioxygenase [Pseudomonas fontis]MDD0993306.1 TauD/TfdA family dioxygenase [Pseudomonas fontis]
MNASLPVQNVRGTTLTTSGLGIELADDTPLTCVRQAVLDHGVSLLRNVRFDDHSFQRFVESLGDKVSYVDDNAQVGYGFSDILKLNGTHDKDKVITGRGSLPLHTDGILLGTQVDLIILYAEDVQGIDEDGATVVCDQLAAWQNMPDSLRQPLLDGKLEYLAFERGYFATVPEGWYPISTFRDYGRMRSLNLALPFDRQAKASWDVRVPGFTAEASAAWFAALEQHLTATPYVYSHRWRTGDLLVIDNQRTLHGRRGLQPQTCRKLLRGQVTFKTIASAPGATLASV